MTLDFEILEKDIAARIGKLTVKGKKIETPALMPVYNPNKPLVTVRELKREFKVQALMVNAYMLLKNRRKEVLGKGLHRFLGFDGVVATDSGSYQLMLYGSVEVTNKDIIEFQNRIGSDIGSFLDIPTIPDAYKPRVIEQLNTTLERAAEAKNANFVVNAGIQGGTYLDLRKKAAKEISRIFQLNAIGGIVPLMEDYRFPELVDVIATVKKTIPQDRVVHAFGLGHPMIFPLAAALGCDLFDSAAYALYAREGRYLTPYGTLRLDELEYLPCCCPVCSKRDLKEIPEQQDKIAALAKHNLHVSLQEINKVKQAVKENRLWELLAVQCRSHPNLLSALERMLKHKKWLSELDLITKKSSFYYTGPESKHRTEVLNAKKRLKNVAPSKLNINIPPFGKIPLEVKDVYPFGSAMAPESANREEPKITVKDKDKIARIMDYQFGAGCGDILRKIRNIRIKKSRKTGRIRWVYSGRELIASVRASDHFIIPKMTLAEKIHEKFDYPKLRVVVNDEAAPFAREGRSVFCKFVVKVDLDLRCGDEVLVVDSKDVLLNTGTLVLSPREVMDFRRGAAVRIR